MKFWTHLDFVYRWTDMYKSEQKHLENLFNLTNEVNIARILWTTDHFPETVMIFFEKSLE